MREIKFKVFDPDTKTMQLVGALDWDGDCSKIITCNTHQTKHYFGHNKDTDPIIMQYTGLKDKNGKEIYEGDIIPYHFTKKIFGIVKYGEYKNRMGDDSHGGHVGFYLEFQDDSAKKTLRVDLMYWIKVSEVIGNIYENSELIGATT